MSDLIITPNALNGKIMIPPSKSLCHRAIIAAGLSMGKSSISNVSFSEDIVATCNGIRNMGVAIDLNKDSIIINGTGFYKSISDSSIKEIDCHESGSTLRFLIPLALLKDDEIKFKGREKLLSRPIIPYYEIFKKNSVYFKEQKGEYLTIKGNIKPGTYFLPGNISSQFITGLMFALPVLNGDSSIVLSSPLESKAYVDMTIDILKMYNIEIENCSYKRFNINGQQEYKPFDYTVEGDFSQAAFWLVAGVLSGEIECTGINLNSFQGDKVIIDILRYMNGNVEVRNESITSRASKTKGIVIDVSQCPDIMPILTVLACFSEGTTEIINAGRLRYKESDRLKAISTEMNKMGGNVIEKDDSLIIKGRKELQGGIVDSWNDHRIEMALAIASTKCRNKVIIRNSGSVKKSYPDFYEKFITLGGKLE